MSFSDASPSKPKKLLIITSSGGGGLLQAANAKEQQARLEDPAKLIVRRDVLKDWAWFGKHQLNLWNSAQLKGNVGFQSFCVWGQLLFDRFFWPNIFFSALRTFFKEEIDEIIDTQNLGTSAILTALRIYNRRRNKQVTLKKVVVDLPTKKATHFFWPIKRLNRKNKKLLKLTTIAPLLEPGQSLEDFWQKNCRLSNEDIHYEDVNVRQAFRRFQGRERSGEPLPIRFKAKSPEELKLLKKTYEKGSVRAKITGQEVEFLIAPEDKVITVLLGSQPANEATFNYMKRIVQTAKEKDLRGVKTHLFVFCSNHEPGEESLFRKVCDTVARLKDYPKKLTVIPFTFQNDETIAPLFYSSQITITRSGGQTAMELMCVNKGEIWIHSETRKAPDQRKDPTPEELLKGIPGWEAANALYLQKVRGAKIITPEIVGPAIRSFIRSTAQPSESSRLAPSPLEPTA